MDFNNLRDIIDIFFRSYVRISYGVVVFLSPSIQDKFDTENRYIETKNVNRILRYNYIFRF